MGSADTIFALSSGRPPAAVSIIRVSGPRAHEAGRRLAGSLPEPRGARVRVLRNANGDVLDDALVLRFDAPATSTGEDVVELHCHGGRAVVDAVLSALTSIDGLRAALPGEFTRRAFENGRIDLTEAEGLADLLEAETDAQRKAALAMAEGGLKRQVEDWVRRTVQLSARAEAAIDYVGEDDIEADEALKGDCAALALELSQWLSRPRVEPLRDGIRIVVAGPPNAGKSSLINELVGEERAIVTSVPGTTRDYIEVPLAIDGIPFLLTDTAGLRETSDQIEAAGVARANTLIAAADIVLWLGEPDDAPERTRVIKVLPRADLPGRSIAPSGTILVSSVTGVGISALLQTLRDVAVDLLPGENALVLNRRQAAHIAEAQVALEDASNDDDIVLAAESLRAARGAFERLTGRAGMESVLDALFSRFCLGK